MQYEFVDGPRTFLNADKANPQKIGEALDAIRRRNDGRLQPPDVVEAAKAKNSPLYRHFQWDVHKAAHAHWVDQARDIIRSIVVVEVDRPPAPAFISVNHPKEGRSYRSAEDVVMSRELSTLVLRQAERDLEAFEKRYAELAEICQIVRTARDRTRQRRTELESQPR